MLLGWTISPRSPNEPCLVRRKFYPGAYGCSGGASYVEARNFDRSVSVYMADSNVKRDKLLVFFHGHGGVPEGNTDLLTLGGQPLPGLDLHAHELMSVRNSR